MIVSIRSNYSLGLRFKMFFLGFLLFFFLSSSDKSCGFSINGNRMNLNIVSLNGEQFSGSHPVLSKSFPHAACAKAEMDRMRTFSETNKRFDKCEDRQFANNSAQSGATSCTIGPGYG